MAFGIADEHVMVEQPIVLLCAVRHFRPTYRDGIAHTGASQPVSQLVVTLGEVDAVQLPLWHRGAEQRDGVGVVRPISERHNVCGEPASEAASTDRTDRQPTRAVAVAAVRKAFRQLAEERPGLAELLLGSDRTFDCVSFGLESTALRQLSGQELG